MSVETEKSLSRAGSEVPAEVPTGHPVAFRYFFWGEFAERCSYYGMRTILTLYLVMGLGFEQTRAGSVQSTFKAACYMLPLLGGYLADRFFGKYWTIVGFSLPYVLGHFILGIPQEWALILALALLAGGSGVIKPNISTLMGETYDQQRPGQEQLRSAAFLWFYFSINVGSLISTVAMPLIRDKWGYAVAFQFPAWLMVASLIVFALGKPHYARENVAHPPLTPEQRRERWRTLGRLAGIFSLIAVYWVGYEHNDNLWVGFISDYVDRRIPGSSTVISPDQLLFVNPLCVIIFAPLFVWLFRQIDPDVRVFTAMNRMLLGFVAGIVSIVLMAVAGWFAFHPAQDLPVFQERAAINTAHEKEKAESKVDVEKLKPKWKAELDAFDAKHGLVDGARPAVSMAWPIVAYILLTIGEVLVYGTGLELAYTAAPSNLKGFVTGCFLLTSALGNIVNIGFTKLYGGALGDPASQRGPLGPGPFFGLTALITLAATVAFYFVGRRFETRAEPEPNA